MLQDHKFTEPWRAIPGSSQELFLASPADITFATGTKGPGKTDAQLMKFRKNVGMGYGLFWRGIIFDREYKNLDDIVSKSKRWFYRYEDGARWYASKSDYKWVWPTGEELLIRAVSHDDDYWDYHGQEFPSINWNEIVKYPTPNLFDSINSLNRSSFTPEKDTPRGKRIVDFKGNVVCDYDAGILLPKIPLQVTMTGNPYGPGHNWVKLRYIDPAPYGQIVKHSVDVFDPQSRTMVTVTKSQVALFGHHSENPYLDAKYIATLQETADVTKRKAWFAGDWDIIIGGALDDVWNKSVHCLPRFTIPHTWKLDRSFDWGSSRPFSVGWFAETTGEDATAADGRKLSFPPGTLIRFAEWYGTQTLGSNVGLLMSATDIAKGIVERENQLRDDGWIAPNARIWAGPTDSAIYTAGDPGEDSIAVKMENNGITWEPADKSPGSRINGLQILRDRLEASMRREGPGFYVMDNCRAFLSIVPVLPRDETNPDDVDTDAEDHVYDETRYRCLKSGRAFVRKLKLVYPR